MSTLLDCSGWEGYAEAFPDVANRRPLEVTGLVADDLDRSDPTSFLLNRRISGEFPTTDPVGPDIRTSRSGHRVKTKEHSR